jgi:hypothetical protein
MISNAAQPVSHKKTLAENNGLRELLYEEQHEKEAF